jgi:hypothetical protein
VADVEVEITEWDGDWPLKGKATAHLLRMGVGQPPRYSREEQAVAALRLAANVCNRTADKIESGDHKGFETHLKIPKGNW